MSYERTRPDGVQSELWDAALRLSDRVGLHLVGAREVAWWQWIPVRLADGGAPDPDTLFPTEIAAVNSLPAPQYCQFLRITPDGMSPRSALAYLAMSRTLKSRWHQDFHRETHTPILSQRRELARLLFT